MLAQMPVSLWIDVRHLALVLLAPTQDDKGGHDTGQDVVSQHVNEASERNCYKDKKGVQEIMCQLRCRMKKGKAVMPCET